MILPKRLQDAWQEVKEPKDLPKITKAIGQKNISAVSSILNGSRQTTSTVIRRIEKWIAAKQKKLAEIK